MSNNSDFVLKRIYKGQVKAVILDWSGTTADAYVSAPAVVKKLAELVAPET